jgi:hypothetical protein
VNTLRVKTCLQPFGSFDGVAYSTNIRTIHATRYVWGCGYHRYFHEFDWLSRWINRAPPALVPGHRVA